MTIPQGYKQTELDTIENMWIKVRLGDISHIRTGGRNGDEAVDNGKYPFFVRSQKVYAIDSYAYDGEAILVPGEGGIGSIFHYINGKFDYHQRVYKISDFADGVCGKYIFFYMSRYFGEYALSLTVKATVDSLRLPTFEDFIIHLPKSVEEQRAIAEALSDVDGLIAALDKKIAKKRLLKQGAMQQLLTGKKRLPGFTDVWVEKKLGNVGSLLNGYAFKSETYSQAGKYKVITIANVQNGRLDTNDCNKVSAIPSDIQKHQILKEGNILISMTGNVGRACLVTTIDCLLNQRVGLFAIRDNSQCDESFIYTIINSKEFETAMIDSGQGAAQSNIGKNDIEGYTFLLPNDTKEQQAIATILSDMDKEIADLEAQHDKYRLLKSGMMQKLLTGQIRLKTE